MKLLCLSNGHGEDAIAVRILKELQQRPNAPKIAALPIVGEGQAYTELGIPLIAPTRKMPSGGFIYMDGRHLWRDIRSGLLQLLWWQFRAVQGWKQQGGIILAVGDIVPLLLAWLSGAPYAFVGTAKSEYYLRDEAGPLPRRSQAQRWEGWSGSVYLPWERWLMSRKRCKAVFPRDSLTAEILQKWSIPAFDLGNPMMDDLEPETPRAVFYASDAEKVEQARSLTITLIPGSRAPEAYANWQQILPTLAGVMEAFRDRTVLFLGAIAPVLSLDPLREALEAEGWRLVNPESPGHFLGTQHSALSTQAASVFTQGKSTLILTQRAFGDCLQQGDFAIAMAGTATEQFVGLGKPAIAIPGKGPQFTPAFAEAQTRLLGPSLILAKQPREVAEIVRSLLRDPDRLQLIADNGRRRMGKPGSADRIADCLMEKLLG
ncbi:lipid-A-disaccharide synthase-related protein [Argonema antarcticum]|uniref:lipid-A-disaccharide synthase-related protein n=1 Tax=Argonema antarcticum TaxID=2942763 RepID=UPI002011DE33|nr:lipid-A-disaccharide synthase-related protein [Argonema antarcticum]MCL1473831.1 lipid-A-disaccharide synthase-related protein [Argonema antarcticum A004/B2]